MVVNNGEAGDLRRHRAHYDVTVMCRLKTIQMFIFYHKLIAIIYFDSKHHLSTTGKLELKIWTGKVENLLQWLLT